MSEYFLAPMKRTNRENGEAIGLNEPRPVPTRQNRSRDWSNNQGIITLGGTAWIHYRSSSNDNCYITRRFGLWERQKSRGSIPEYKWHFQEHASDRVRIRRLTGSICNILSRNGSERRERRQREAFRNAKVFALFVSLPELLVILWQREEVSARNGPTFWPDLILTDHVAFGHSSSNSSNDSVRLFLALTWGFGDRWE